MRTSTIFARAAVWSIQRSTDMGWRSSASGASRSEGRLPAVRHADARPARSLSVKLVTTMSAAPWPRSTGWAISSSVAEEVARMCMSGPERRLDRGAVDALLAYDDEAANARLAGCPWAVEIMIHARA